MPDQLIIKNDEIITDNWVLVDKEVSKTPEEKNLILPLALWLQEHNALDDRKDIGVWFDSEDIPTLEHSQSLNKLPLIAINFPVFTDGRGFSIARLLRERFNYQGELRAVGNVLCDQLCFMKRCGFNSFVLAEKRDLTVALASLNDFTEYYQTSVDQPQPLFRRA